MHAASAFDCALRHRAGLETAGVAAGVLVALAVARCRRREGLTHDAYTHMLREGLHNALGSRLLAGGTVREGAGRRVALRVDVYIELVLRAGDPALDALGADGEGPAARLWEGWG